MKRARMNLIGLGVLAGNGILAARGIGSDSTVVMKAGHGLCTPVAAEDAGPEEVA